MILNKIISSIKKNSDSVSHLSKTKLRNIEYWLKSNNVENVKTPPFANLSTTPISNKKKKCRINTKKINRKSIDPDIEEILNSVYENSWIKNQGVESVTTERDDNWEAKSVSKTNSFHPTRRKIFDNKDEKMFLNNDRNNKTIDLNDSIISGVHLINLEDSDNSFNQIQSNDLEKNSKNVKRIKKLNKPNLRINTPRNKKIKDTSTSIKRNNTTDSSNVMKNSFSSSTAKKTNKKTFLASLSVSTPSSKCHPAAQYYKVNFKSKKDELIKKLFSLYNTEVFEGRLEKDMSFTWNVKLRGTAGYCHNKRITKSTGEIIRQSRIEFSSKIIDRADRLRDTMIHELCHAASWVLDGKLDGHGAVWNSWATKAMNRFPELPKIKRCHNYEIVTKYTYKCTQCGYSIKRHSKSINTDRKRCGYCYGNLELLFNKKKIKIHGKKYHNLSCLRLKSNYYNRLKKIY